MRDFTPPGLGIRSPFGGGAPWLHYRAAGHSPSLSADFLHGRYRKRLLCTFTTLVTHTRASSATYLDSTGTIQTAAADTPRLGHHVWSGSAWVNAGLLIESESRTNLLTQSGDLTHADWTKNNCTVADNGDGSFDVTFASGAVGLLSQYPANSASNACFSFYVKKVDVDDFDITAVSGGTTSGRIRYTFSTDAFSLVGTDFVDYGSTVLDGGWVFIWVVVDGSTANDYRATLAASGTSPTDETIRVKCPQYEVGGAPSSYIPTTTATATRAADSISVDLDAGTYDVRVVTDAGTTDLLSVVHAGGAYWPSQAEGAVARVLVYPEGALA